MQNQWQKIVGVTMLGALVASAGMVWAAPKKAPKGAPVELKIEVFDRDTPGYPADNNFWTRWCQQQFGNPNNIKLKYVPVQRLQEIDKLNILMASNDAPDIVFTYDLFTVYNYVRYGGLTDLKAPLRSQGKNLQKYLSPAVLKEGIFNGKQYAVPAKRVMYGALNGFIRKDWLDKLGLPVPKTTQEWYNTMKAFKEKDPGKLGDRLIPFALMNDSQNIAWNSQLLLDSFKKKIRPDEAKYLPEWQVPGFKDGIRFLNKMYHEGLISPEFALDKDGNMFKRDILQGRVGYFSSNFDEPYRITPGYNNELKKNNPDAKFVPCDPFANSQGKHVKRVYGRNGFYIMVPKSSRRVNEAIRYLDWMSQPEVLEFLQFGEKGTHYKELRDGVPVSILVDGEKRQTDDIAIIVNGKDLGDPDKNMQAGASRCPGWEKEWVASYQMSISGEQYVKPVFPIESEAKLKKSLYGKDSEIFTKSLTVAPAEFDKTYDALVQEYMKMGGKQVMDDRKAYLKGNKK